MTDGTQCAGRSELGVNEIKLRRDSSHEFPRLYNPSQRPQITKEEKLWLDTNLTQGFARSLPEYPGVWDLLLLGIVRPKYPQVLCHDGLPPNSCNGPTETHRTSRRKRICKCCTDLWSFPLASPPCLAHAEEAVTIPEAKEQDVLAQGESACGNDLLLEPHD